jgi:hypothetical protein
LCLLSRRRSNPATDPLDTFRTSDGTTYVVEQTLRFTEDGDGLQIDRVIVSRASGTPGGAADPYDESGTDTFADDPD